MFGTKNSKKKKKKNWLQEIIEYKTNEQSTKYSYWNMQIKA